MKKIIKIMLYSIIYILVGFIISDYLGRVFDEAYANRSKAAGYYCAECLTDFECWTYCSK